MRHQYKTLLMLLALSACRDSAASAESDDGRVLGVPSRIDLGDVFPGTSVWVKLNVRNDSAAAFYLFDTTTSCGCMLAQFTPSLIHPGDTKTIEVLLVPKSRRGPLREKVRFFSSNEALTAHEVIITAMSVGSDVLTPAIDYGLFTPELGVAQKVAVEVDEKFYERYSNTILQAKPLFLCTERDLPISIENIDFPLIGGRRYLSCTISIDACSRRGLFNSSIRLFLSRDENNQSGAFLEFPIHGSCLPYFYVEPSVIELAGLNGDQVAMTVRSTDQAEARFPKTTGVEGGVRWKLDTTTMKLTIDVERSKIPNDGSLQSIQIPFIVADETMDLIIPVHGP